MPQGWNTLLRKGWILQTIGQGTKKDPSQILKWTVETHAEAREGEGEGGRSPENRAARAGLWVGAGVCSVALTHLLLVPGQGGPCFMGGLADIWGPWNRGEVCGGEAPAGALDLPPLCPVTASLDKGATPAPIRIYKDLCGCQESNS